jgi:hypothetical protein
VSEIDDAHDAEDQVSPLATRNSSRPYCTLLRIWISHSTAWVRHARGIGA